MKTIIIAAAALFVGGGFVYLSGAREPSAPTLTLSEQCSVAMAKSEENPIMRQMMDNELSNEELLALDKTQLEESVRLADEVKTVCKGAHQQCLLDAADKIGAGGSNLSSMPSCALFGNRE